MSRVPGAIVPIRGRFGKDNDLPKKARETLRVQFCRQLTARKLPPGGSEGGAGRTFALMQIKATRIAALKMDWEKSLQGLTSW